MEVELSPLLVPFLQIGLHHLHKVLWGTVAVSWHIHQNKLLPYFEEIHLLGVALGRAFFFKKKRGAGGEMEERGVKKLL